MLPRVRELEQELGHGVVAIGVHAGKYHRERSTDAIAEACRREGVTHAVLNDRRFRYWRENAVAAWPTIVVVDPEGYVVGQQSGELPYAGLRDFVARVVKENEEKGMIDSSPWPLGSPPEEDVGGALRYPAKLAADIEGRVAVADTGHHRIVFGHALGNSLEVRAVSLDERSSTSREPACKVRVGENPFSGPCDGIGLGWYHEGVTLRFDEIADPRQVGQYAGTPTCHRLPHRPGGAVRRRDRDADVGGLVVERHVRVGDVPDHLNPVGERNPSNR